jgi:gamma-glutamylcysteine synthetase
LHELAASVVRIADGGLARRAERMGIETEQKYLNPLRGILARGTTTAEMLLEKYMRNLDLDLFRLILNT